MIHIDIENLHLKFRLTKYMPCFIVGQSNFLERMLLQTHQLGATAHCPQRCEGKNSTGGAARHLDCCLLCCIVIGEDACCRSSVLCLDLLLGWLK